MLEKYNKILEILENHQSFCEKDIELGLIDVATAKINLISSLKKDIYGVFLWTKSSEKIFRHN